MKYAIIQDGKVKNIIIADYTNANVIAKRSNAIAVNCDNYVIGVGTIYEDGYFLTQEDKRDEQGNLLVPAGTVIKREFSNEQKFSKLVKENEQLQEIIDKLIINSLKED
ncbi:hypothetical protein [Vallitalea guaymasensis]|uniref:hypothetical protein n=1 Tax=Vallitalea guaymasensis TaxID=1185412 RepID=UPI000DE49851|nr:hypothetical protein [Vallitalea guaymasensis]